MIINFPALYFTRDCLNPKGYGVGWEVRKMESGEGENRKSHHIPDRGMLTSRSISPSKCPGEPLEGKQTDNGDKITGRARNEVNN